jgi:hypothetical protein
LPQDSILASTPRERRKAKAKVKVERVEGLEAERIE